MQNGGADANAAPMEPQHRSLDLWEPPRSPATGSRRDAPILADREPTSLATVAGGATANATLRSPDTGPRCHAAILADRLRERGHAVLAERAERHAELFVSWHYRVGGEPFIRGYLRAFDPDNEHFDGRDSWPAHPVVWAPSRLREMGHAELAEGADTGPRQSTRSIYTGDVLAPYHPSQPTNAAPRSRGTGPRSHAAILAERELAKGFERTRRSGSWRRQAAALADRLREMGHAELAEGAERHDELLRIDNGPDSDLFIESYLRRFDPAHPAFDPDPRGYLRAHDPPPPSPPRSTASGEEAPVHRGAGAREAVKEQPQVSQATCTRFAPRSDDNNDDDEEADTGRPVKV